MGVDAAVAPVLKDKVNPMSIFSPNNDTLPPLTIPELEDLPIFVPDLAVLDRNKIIGFDSRDSRGRPFKLLRTQFANLLQQKRARLVGITSAAPNAGKSFISLNLAASLSRLSGARVYLADLDLRRASVAEGLGLDLEHGIADFLEGTVDDPGSLGWRVEGCNLAVFPTGRPTTSSAELIAGDRYIKLVEAFRTKRDTAIILFDLPPAFANDDTMLAIKSLDGYIMVVDAGVTTRRQVSETMAMLTGTPCLGAVLNRYSGGFTDHYGYGYGYRDYAKYYE
jgi:Mrp family chromosome partitioning ATPase